MNEDVIYLVLSIVQEIPYGQVASYKQIATLAGMPKNARLVGKILSVSSMYGSFPCYRVVNGVGRLVPGWQEQRTLLEQEGVVFNKSGHVDMKRCQWKLSV